MKINRSMSAMLASAGLVLAALGATGAAQAQDVYWSVGLSSPGMQMGVSSSPPVLVQPAYRSVYQPVYQAVYPPVYERVHQPRYVVPLAPRALIYAPPVPVLLAPPRYIRADWRYPAYRHGWQNQRQEIERADHDGRG